MSGNTVARIDPTACMGCEQCVDACRHGAHGCVAPDPKGGHAPVVDESVCGGCGLCREICPVRDGITMVEPGCAGRERG